MPDLAVSSEAEVVDAVRAAREARSPLEIVGAGTKRRLGREVRCDTALKTAGLSGIVDYRPEELIVTALPSTPVREIAAALQARNQRLGFDPPDWGPLFGAQTDAGTIGGAISADLNGPVRVRFGAARDHLLGIRGVNGFAEAFKAGGKVVKNVTGFDIPKLVCGGFGTICVLTEVTLRVFPKPGRALTFAVQGVSPADGLALLRRVWSSPLEPTGLAYVPEHVATLVGLPRAAALIRLEGTAAPLEEKQAALMRLASSAVVLEEGDAVFRRVGDGAAFVADRRALWRIALPPSRAAALLGDVEGASWLADWAGSLLWIATDLRDMHALAARHEGHATLVRGAEREVPFPPLSPERLAISRAVKAAFDPLSLFNPGRMYEGV